MQLDRKFPAVELLNSLELGTKRGDKIFISSLSRYFGGIALAPSCLGRLASFKDRLQADTRGYLSEASPFRSDHRFRDYSRSFRGLPLSDLSFRRL